MEDRGPAATEVQTPFGGGKTHALLTLYHLISSPEKALAIPSVAEALGGTRIPKGARVLVFDGQEASTEPAMKEDGSSVKHALGRVGPPGEHRRLLEAGHRLRRPRGGSGQRSLPAGAGRGVSLSDPAG